MGMSLNHTALRRRDLHCRTLSALFWGNRTLDLIRGNEFEERNILLNMSDGVSHTRRPRYSQSNGD